MKIQNIIIFTTLFYMILLSDRTFALTVQQFKTICLSQDSSCTEHPMLTAYVGGGLDLVASLQEETDYLGRLYCSQPETLFDIKRIIQFIVDSGQEDAELNAMLRLVAYLEQHGGC